MAAVTLAWGTLPAPAAGIEPVFEHLLGDEDVPLPILKAQENVDCDDETFDGSFVMDSYGGLERYDDSRLLLGVRENGIDETDPGHDANLAAQFPDRSLIWIDHLTGAPLGVALVVGFNPVPLDPGFLSAGGTVLDYYFAFTVDDAGVVYIGYKNKIVRYAPDGQGGFGDPSVAYTHANDGSAQWAQWRFETLRAWGSGADTQLVAGGKTWRDGQRYRLFETADGLNFVQVDFSGFAGGGSRVVPAKQADSPTEQWMFGTQYPGSSNGIDSAIVKNRRDPELGIPFEGVAYDLETDPDAGYHGQFYSDVDLHPQFPYLVSYSTPSWNTLAVIGEDPENPGADRYRPGFIAVHDPFFDPNLVDPETGEGKAELLDLHRIEAFERQEITPNCDGVEFVGTLWHGTLGKVAVNVLPGMRTGQAEVLWYSGIYGYGRYLLDFAPKPIVITQLQLDGQNNTASLTWTSEAGSFYDVQKSSLTEGASWELIRASIPSAGDDVTTAAVDASEPTAFYRVGPGLIFREDFEGDANGWTSGTSDDPFPNASPTRWESGAPSNTGPAQAHGGSRLYGTSLTGNYENLTNIILRSPVIDLTTAKRATLKFFSWQEASPVDGGQVNIYDETGETLLSSGEPITGNTDGWTEVSLNLARLADGANVLGMKIVLEFRFLSDDQAADNGPGWYIDDLRVE